MTEKEAAEAEAEAARHARVDSMMAGQGFVLPADAAFKFDAVVDGEGRRVSRFREELGGCEGDGET